MFDGHDRQLDQLIESELADIKEDRVTVFLCCCFANGKWSAVNTCTSPRISRTNDYTHAPMTSNKAYRTYLIEGLLSLAAVPEYQPGNKLAEALVKVKEDLEDSAFKPHLAQVYRRYVDAVFKASKSLSKKREALGIEPVQPEQPNSNNMTERQMRRAMAQYNSDLKVYDKNKGLFEKARTVQEKNLRMQLTLKSLNGLLAFAYFPWENSIDAIDTAQIKKFIRSGHKDIEKKFRKDLGALANIESCMHCAEDNFMQTCSAANIAQINGASQVLMFSILRNSDENEEKRASPPCAFCQSHFRSKCKKCLGALTTRPFMSGM